MIQSPNIAVDGRVFGRIILDLLLHTVSMEGMSAWEDIKVPSEDRLVAKVTCLIGLDDHVSMLLFSLLLSEGLSTHRVVL